MKTFHILLSLLLLLIPLSSSLADTNEIGQNKFNQFKQTMNIVISLNAANALKNCHADVGSLNTTFFKAVNISKMTNQEEHKSLLKEKFFESIEQLKNSIEYEEKIFNRSCEEIKTAINQTNKSLSTNIENTISKKRKEIVATLTKVHKAIALMIAGDSVLQCGITYDEANNAFKQYLTSLKLDELAHTQKINELSKQFLQDSKFIDKIKRDLNCDLLKNKNIELSKKLADLLENK